MAHRIPLTPEFELDLSGGWQRFISIPGTNVDLLITLTAPTDGRNRAVMPEDITDQIHGGGDNGAGDPASMHVLLAEDHKVNQMLATTMLQNLGHTVDTVINGAEAVEAVQTHHYDVVLMDIQMPGMTGVAATIAIRKLEGECSTVPVIAMTANAMKGDREQYLEAGMDDYLSKPVIISDLAQIILKWGSRRSGGGTSTPEE